MGSRPEALLFLCRVSCAEVAHSRVNGIFVPCKMLDHLPFGASFDPWLIQKWLRVQIFEDFPRDILGSDSGSIPLWPASMFSAIHIPLNGVRLTGCPSTCCVCASGRSPLLLADALSVGPWLTAHLAGLLPTCSTHASANAWDLWLYLWVRPFPSWLLCFSASTRSCYRVGKCSALPCSLD